MTDGMIDRLIAGVVFAAICWAPVVTIHLVRWARRPCAAPAPAGEEG